MNKSERKSILKIYTKKHALNIVPDLMSEFSKLVASFDKQEKKATTFLLINHWKEKLSTSHLSFMNAITNALFAVKLRNVSMLKRNIEFIISMTPLQISAEFKPQYFKDNKSYQTFVLDIMKSLDLFSESLGDKKLIQILMAHLSYVINEKAFLDYAKDHDANWGLAKVESTLDSYSYGRRFPAAWLWRLQGGALLSKMDSFLKKSLVSDNFLNISDYELWTLKYFYPPNEVFRKEIVKRLIRNWKSSSYNLKQVVMDLIHIPVIKSELSKKRRVFKKPVFQIERSFYWENLQNGQNIERVIFELIKLGERDIKLLWWLIL
jgi:hypothetical protein